MIRPRTAATLLGVFVLATLAAARPRAAETSIQPDPGEGEAEARVWHPLRSGCFREELGQSAKDWGQATTTHEGATSTSSLRFWSFREFGAEVLVIDSGGSPRLSADGSPFVVVASGSLDRTCVERLPLDACTEAVELRRSLLAHRIRIGDAVADEGGMTLLLGDGGYGVEVMDRFAKRNRWYFGEQHPDFSVMRERFRSVDRCFAKVRDAGRRWAADPEAAPPAI
jgi:hypothetical protein